MEEEKLVLFSVIFTISLIPLAYGELPPACVSCEEDAKTSAEKAKNETSLILVFTDKSTYHRGEQIKVHGTVKEFTSGDLVTVTVISPTNNVVTIDQIPVNNYGEFNTVYSTSSKWEYDGTYTFRAQYGNQANSNKVFVELTGGMNQYEEEEQKIPEWVRNIFIWYGDGLVSEDELINALRFLIREGTIIV